MFAMAGERDLPTRSNTSHPRHQGARYRRSRGRHDRVHRGPRQRRAPRDRLLELLRPRLLRRSPTPPPCDIPRDQSALSRRRSRSSVWSGCVVLAVDSARGLDRHRRGCNRRRADRAGRREPRQAAGRRDGLGDRTTEASQVLGTAAEHVLELLHPEEVAVHGIVDVGAHPAVQVLRRVHDALPAFGRPVLGDVDLFARGQTFVRAATRPATS